MRRFSRAAGSELHQRIAESLRDRFPERAEREPGIVAHHFTQAGLSKTAIEWWGRAGSRAMHRFANHEAALSYVNGLEPDGGSAGERRARSTGAGVQTCAWTGTACGTRLRVRRGRTQLPGGRPARRGFVGQRGCFHERPRAVALPLRPKRTRSRAGACRAAARHWSTGVRAPRKAALRSALSARLS